MNFPTSIWTTIRAIRREPDRVKDEVVRRYRTPVYEFVRRMGIPHEDAEDLSQEIFVRVCSDGFLAKVDPQKGRFRSLILAVTRNVVASFRRKELAPMRDRRKTVALEEAEIPMEVEPDPDFDRLWVKNLMSQGIARLRNDVATSALKLQLEGRSYQEIGETLKKSETEVTNYIHRAKKRLRTEIEALIRDYSGDDLQAEIETLTRLL
jgi:RNA polymerase sigma-70 factor (ECF subfamily)